MSKISDQNKIEASNLVEEANDIMRECIRCGLCKALSPQYKATREEHASPRGQAILLGGKILDKTVFESTLCGGAQQACPLNIDIDEALLKAREALVLKGKGLKQDKDMIKNLKKYGSPYGKENEEDVSVIWS